MFSKKLFLSFLFCSYLFSHPVIFKGGKVFWITQQPNSFDFRFGKSLSANWLVGGRFYEDKSTNESFGLIINNYILKRWNNPDSQANLYLLSSIGSEIETSKTLASLGIHADWEDRRFMTMQMAEYYSHSSMWMLDTRLAISPYLVDYTKMSTWLIAHYKISIKDGKQTSELLPIIRLFKSNYLIEFGANKDNDAFLSFMLHF